ncbi:MAG TPA: imidazole glycerol phosphate synthase subunit HisH [Polyangia bacterium]
MGEAADAEVSRKVAIIDYQAGNLFSVTHACEAVGLQPVVTADPAVIADSAAAILPGVGAFGEAMGNLRARGLDRAIAAFVASGRPFLGVCLGLQLLFSRSEEFGDHDGLGIIPGRVIRFPDRDPEGQAVRVPQIGWNQITPPADRPAAWADTPLSSIASGEHVYFVHSYHVVPDRIDDTLCVASYGGRSYCAGVRRGNLLALQFHPEKSAHAGLRIYRDWAAGLARR